MNKNKNVARAALGYYVIFSVLFFIMPKELRVNPYLVGCHILVCITLVYLIYMEKKKALQENPEPEKKPDYVLYLVPVISTALLALILPQKLAPMMYIVGFFLTINVIFIFTYYYWKLRRTGYKS